MKIEAGNISQAIKKFCKFLLSSVVLITPAPDRMEMKRLCMQPQCTVNLCSRDTDLTGADILHRIYA